jgi:signal transduction histidine kinase
MGMKVKPFIICLLLFTLTLNFKAIGADPVAAKGVIDLRNIKNPERFYIRLNGEWEFYWKKILRPYDFSHNNPVPDFYGNVPSYWTDYKQEPVNGSKTGYATYRLIVLLPDSCSSAMGIDLPVFDSSYDIYLNGKYYGSSGIPGKSESETVPEYKRNFYRITNESDSLVIIINVSNYHHRQGGFWLPVKLGTFSEVQSKLAQNWAGEWSVISLLIGFSIFCLFFYFINKQEKILFFFSLATLGLALRPLFTSHYLILNLIPVQWIWIVRFEYISLFIVIIGWSWFVECLYPSRLIRLISWIISVVFGTAFMMVLLLPVKVFSYTTLIYYPSMFVLMIYIFYCSIRGSLKGKMLDIIYLAAFILLLLGGIHDISVASGKSDSSTGYLLTYIIVVFVFIQVALLLYKWVKENHEKEKLRSDLEYLNKNLELLIQERTSELQKRNIEIENQNNMIAVQNKQLSDTIQIKNRIFSVVAHDLRSPVVNILYMLNLLKEKEYKEKYDTLANSSIQYAQLVISLLENMLVWGRGQEEKIKFSPEKRDLADIILTNLSIFKHTADEKEIAVNFTQVGNSVAYFDKDLLDIIIRNLLSNAVKYTPRGGRISILLKDKSQTGEGILLKICDNGVGIPEKKQALLFTSDEIESSPGTENEKGTGLGLKLCHELVKINNGDITVESKAGEGTCFLITLPVS